MMAAMTYSGSPYGFTNLSPVGPRESVYAFGYGWYISEARIGVPYPGLRSMTGHPDGNPIGTREYVYTRECNNSAAFGHRCFNSETIIGVPYSGICPMACRPGGKFGNPKVQDSAVSSYNNSLGARIGVPCCGIRPMTNHPGGKYGNPEVPVSAASSANDWMDKVSVGVTLHVDQLRNTHPYIPVGGVLLVMLLVWMVLPKFLKRLHILLSGIALWKPVSYEKGFFGALQAPIQYLITFMASSLLGVMVAPSIIAPRYIPPAWKCATINSLVWFLYLWKTNAIKRVLTTMVGDRNKWLGFDRNGLLSVDKVLSVDLFVIGWMASAEIFGATVKSILVCGGIGIAPVAFAARGVLRDVFKGIFLGNSELVSVGDWLRIGSVEGEVLDIGFTATTLLTGERKLEQIPNYCFFSSQPYVRRRGS